MPQTTTSSQSSNRSLPRFCARSPAAHWLITSGRFLELSWNFLRTFLEFSWNFPFFGDFLKFVVVVTLVFSFDSTIGDYSTPNQNLKPETRNRITLKPETRNRITLKPETRNDLRFTKPMNVLQEIQSLTQHFQDRVGNLGNFLPIKDVVYHSNRLETADFTLISTHFARS